MADTKRPGSPGLLDSKPTKVARTETTPSTESVASPIVTLLVGPDKKPLTAHKSILTKVPYFAACLASNRFEEGQTNTITFPEDDPDAMAHIIFALNHGYLDTTPTLGEPADRNEKDASMHQNDKDGLLKTADEYLKAYVVADKMCMEKFGNLVTDWFIAFAKGYGFNLEDIADIAFTHEGDSPLKRFMVADLSWNIRYFGWDQYKKIADYAQLEEDFSTYPEIGVVIAKALASCSTLQLEPRFRNKCKWHIHKETPICSPSSQ